MKRMALTLLALAVALAGWLAWRLPGLDARPAEGQTRVVSGPVPVTYHRLEPSGPPRGTVLLLASLGRPASDFNALATALAAGGWRTLAVESRGVGQWRGGGFWGPADLSGFADDALRVLDDAQVPEPVVVVGHAFGNRVARMLATRAPARTAGVVLLAAGERPQLPADIEAALRRSVLSPLPFKWRELAVGYAFFAPGNAVHADWQRGWSAWAALAQSRAVRATPAAAFRAAGRAPVLVVQPSDDVVAPPATAGAQLAAELGTRARLVVIPRAGHALLPEQPDAVAAAVLGFVNEVGGHRD